MTILYFCPTVTGSPARIAEQLAHYADQGITEIIYQPAGPDITGELERFITIAQQTNRLFNRKEWS